MENRLGCKFQQNVGSDPQQDILLLETLYLKYLAAMLYVSMKHDLHKLHLPIVVLSGEHLLYLPAVKALPPVMLSL